MRDLKEDGNNQNISTEKGKLQKKGTDIVSKSVTPLKLVGNIKNSLNSLTTEDVKLKLKLKGVEFKLFYYLYMYNPEDNYIRDDFGSKIRKIRNDINHNIMKMNFLSLDEKETAECNKEIRRLKKERKKLLETVKVNRTVLGQLKLKDKRILELDAKRRMLLNELEGRKAAAKSN